MKQSGPVRQEPEAATGRSSRSIDEWLAAAVAEQAGRVASRGAPSRTDEPARAEPARAEPARAEPEALQAPPARSFPAVGADEDYDKLIAATTASERRAIETATKTAVALGSVASWIERAQEKLADTERASTEAQAKTAAVVTDAIGQIGTRLDEIERKVDAVGSVATAEQPQASASAFDDVLRGFESRIQDMADKLVARPIARRGASPADEVDAAVAEIRSHQAHLESGGTHDRGETRAQADILTLLRSDLDRLSEKIDVSREAATPGVDSLRREIDGLHESMATLATRDHLSSLEHSIATLSQEISEAGARGGNLGEMTGNVDDLQAEVQRLAGGGDEEHLTRITRNIDVLSHKLDIVAASGTDQAAIEALSRDMGEIRSALTGIATPGDIAGLSEQLIELKIELARMGSQQVDAREFNSLRSSVDDLKSALVRSGQTASAAESGFDAGDVDSATRAELRPIAAMLVTLMEKFDRLHKLGDTDALEQIERQIAGLTSSIADNAGRDPALATLSSAMTALMNEVAGWREGTTEIAERAARNAVAERLGSADLSRDAFRRDPDPDLEEPAVRPAPEQPERDGRQDVHARLDDVVRRIGGLETPPARPDPVTPESASSSRSGLAADAPLVHVAPSDRVEATSPPLGAPADIDAPLDWEVKDEILLEPGTQRPQEPPLQSPASPAAPDAPDVKASFIAAARRAAQAAAADAGRGRPRRSAEADTPAAATARGSSKPQIQAMLGRSKRPLMVAATALLVAYGGYELYQGFAPKPVSTAAHTTPVPTRPAPSAPPAVSSAPSAPSIPAPAPSAQTEPEPQTTQSVPERSATMTTAPERRELQSPVQGERAQPTAPVPAKIEARDPGSASPTAAGNSTALGAQAALTPPDAAVSARPAAPVTQPSGASPDSAASLAALKLAAQSGDPTALYDLGVRMIDGRGVARDPKAALALFEKAGEKNLAPAQYRAANLYEKGVGVPRDVEAAKTLYQRAAENGNTRAMHNLAVLMAEGATGKPDYNGAIVWFQRAAEQGVRDSQFNLAVLYARGLGTGQDLVKSYGWFAVAAAQGDDEAGRKRDEVGQRLSAADLARAKAIAEHWRATPPIPSANEVQVPASGWQPDATGKRASAREGKS